MLSREDNLTWLTSHHLEVGIVEAAEPDDTPTARFPFITLIWLPVVVGVPYAILGLVGGFGNSFRSGEASTFICGALVAAVGETLIEQGKNESSWLKKLRQVARANSKISKIISSEVFWFGFVGIPALGILAWNMYFALQDKTVSYPPIDWLQVVAFASALVQLTSVRFFLSDYFYDFFVLDFLSDFDLLKTEREGL